MQPTKYHSQSNVEPSGALLSSLGGDCAPCGGVCASAPHRAGREAPLDWIEEHLTSTIEEPVYRQGVHGGYLVKNWFFPQDWDGQKGDDSFVLKIQPFAKGGYEATIRAIDLERVGNAIVNGGRRGVREAPDVLSIENQEKAASRSKRKMRHLVKNMMADHLVTFTKTEGPNTRYWSGEDFASWEDGGRAAWERENGAFWGAAEWSKAWDRFRRLLTRFLGDFPYVAILEKHKKGNYHLHVAWCGRVNVGIVRKMWLAALGGGVGAGNIDAKKIKVPAGGDRASRIARYISKYVSKHFEADARFNKKRYWASRQTLEDVRRYVLSADTLDGARLLVEGMLGFKFSERIALCGGRIKFDSCFFFPDGAGVWWSHVPGLHDGKPPPF